MVRRFADAGWNVKAGVRDSLDGQQDDRFHIVPMGDMTAVDDWTPILSGSDVVVHLAARAHKTAESAGDGAELFRKVNVEATLNLARGAARARVKRFVFLSSAGVMGDFTDRPKRETDAPRPVSQYAVSKLEAETQLRAFCESVDMELVIFRPTLVYGEGNPGNLERLIKLIKLGIPLPFGRAQNRRSLLGVGHLAEVILKAAELPGLDGEVFLVADGDDVTTADIVRCLAQGCGRKVTLIGVPLSLLRLVGKAAGKSAEIEKLFGSFQVDTAKKRAVFGDVSREETMRGLVAAGRSSNA
ncbi:NAD-dependent epimerase/dehydratase family protein [Brucella sp. IR073]|uniref:NAD-dependent epimerase/dehydratase family protein n=1 Tax=Brucella sp. IR073 TaxID=3121517 RepID=UPI003B981EA3